VGHETDFTIIDFVADLRAPTPSAAAEMVIRSRQEVEEQVQSLQQRLEKGLRYHLLMARQNLTELAQHGAFARMMDLIRRRQQRLDELLNRLAHSERDVLEGCRRRFETLAGAVRHYDARRILTGLGKELEARAAALASATRTVLLQRRARVEQLSGQLEALSPTAILERGYALVFDSSGKLLTDAARVNAGDEISARLARGTVTAIVKQRSG
jgi:exodeoxyribonuclease VII large subunit